MTGPRHSTDNQGGSITSDMPTSYGPDLTSLIVRQKSTKVSRQDESRGLISNEPKPGESLDFH